MKFIRIFLLLLIVCTNQLFCMNNDARTTYTYDLQDSDAQPIAFILYKIITETHGLTASKITISAPTIINGNNGSKFLITANSEDWKRIQKLIEELSKPQ